MIFKFSRSMTPSSRCFESTLQMVNKATFVLPAPTRSIQVGEAYLLGRRSGGNSRGDRLPQTPRTEDG